MATPREGVIARDDIDAYTPGEYVADILCIIKYDAVKIWTKRVPRQIDAEMWFVLYKWRAAKILTQLHARQQLPIVTVELLTNLCQHDTDIADLPLLMAALAPCGFVEYLCLLQKYSRFTVLQALLHWTQPLTYDEVINVHLAVKEDSCFTYIQTMIEALRKAAPTDQTRFVTAMRGLPLDDHKLVVYRINISTARIYYITSNGEDIVEHTQLPQVPDEGVVYNFAARECRRHVYYLDGNITNRLCTINKNETASLTIKGPVIVLEG